MTLARSASWNGTEPRGRGGSDLREGTHFALYFIRLRAKLCSALIGLTPFLAHDNIVFLELLDRFEARGALVLDSLRGDRPQDPCLRYITRYINETEKNQMAGVSVKTKIQSLFSLW